MSNSSVSQQDASMLRGIGKALVALVDELEAARETKPVFKYVYAITRRGFSETVAETVGIYVDRETAQKDVDDLNEMGKKMDSAVSWAVSAHILTFD